MATTSTPVSTWVASILTATGLVQSTSIYITVNNTGGWELQVPIRVQNSTVSNDHVVSIYALMDGTAAGNYDTTAFATVNIARIAAQSVQASVRLATGQYLIRVLIAGPSSQSVSILTQELIGSITNV